MLTHRGFSAWIQNLDGQEAYPEYLAATDEVEHRVSCWIPCREGEVRTFTIHHYSRTLAYLYCSPLAYSGGTTAVKSIHARS